MAPDSVPPDRVLVVDREGPTRRDLLEALEGASVEVTTAASVDDAVGAGEVDALVVEPGVEAGPWADVLDRLRERHPFAPLLVFAGEGSEALAGEAVAAGASAYVPKSAGPATVLTRLRELADDPRRPGAREGEARYRHLIETSPAPINLFDASGTTIWGNDAVLDLLGLEDRDELVGHSIFEFIDPEDHGLARRELELVVEERVSIGPTRMDLRRADGEARHILVSTAPGRFRGEPIGQAVVVDVTALLETQEALQAERRVVDNALDTLADPFFIVDPSGRLERWNAAAVATTGSPEADLGGRSVSDLVPPGDRERVLDAVETALLEGGAQVEADVLTAAGERVPHEIRLTRLENQDGSADGVVCIARDVSELRERERHLLVVEQLLRHNVRNAVNVIGGYAESIRDGAVEPDDAVQAILRHGRRLVEQAEKEKQLVGLMTRSADRRPVDVDATVEAAVEAARDRHPEADIRFSPSGDAPVRSAPGLSAAVQELVDNAITHGDREPPTVRVEVTTADGACRVAVADDGPGIPDIERSVLSVDAQIDQLHHGSGVGLWLVHWTARAAGGTVDIEADEPRGTVVTLTLPADGPQ